MNKSFISIENQFIPDKKKVKSIINYHFIKHYHLSMGENFGHPSNSKGKKMNFNKQSNKGNKGANTKSKNLNNQNSSNPNAKKKKPKFNSFEYSQKQETGTKTKKPLREDEWIEYTGSSLNRDHKGEWNYNQGQNQKQEKKNTPAYQSQQNKKNTSGNKTFVNKAKNKFNKESGGQKWPAKKPYALKNKPQSKFNKFKKEEEQDDLIRLNKFIADAGICSRREADELILKGMITVNGEIIIELGHKVHKNDVVKYKELRLLPDKFVYLLLNKPKDYITTTEDPEDRKTVMELVQNACKERIYPVGRLDRNTTGLLLLTNDGELAQKLSHPSNEISKIYQVELDKPIKTEDFEKLFEGIELEDGKAFVDDAVILTSEKNILGVEIHLGRNRIIRRMFEQLGYEVVKLDRTMFAGLTKKDLPRGKWRFLTEQEVIKLKYFNQN